MTTHRVGMSRMPAAFRRRENLADKWPRSLGTRPDARALRATICRPRRRIVEVILVRVAMRELRVRTFSKRMSRTREAAIARSASSHHRAVQAEDEAPRRTRAWHIPSNWRPMPEKSRRGRRNRPPEMPEDARGDVVVRLPLVKASKEKELVAVVAVNAARAEHEGRAGGAFRIGLAAR